MIYHHPNYACADFPDLNLRRELISAYKKLIDLGLNRGTSGNCSIQCDDNLFLITPSGTPLERMTPASIVPIGFDGAVREGAKPSTEWQLHFDILNQRSDARAVVHTHSVAATALACLRQGIPAFHYMVAIAGGDSIRCAPYALFGTQALSNAVLIALQGRKACLMANHGVIAIGRSLNEALQIALEVETLAAQYLHACSIAEPDLLSLTEMEEVIEKFKDYGCKFGNNQI